MASNETGLIQEQMPPNPGMLQLVTTDRSQGPLTNLGAENLTQTLLEDYFETSNKEIDEAVSQCDLHKLLKLPVPLIVVFVDDGDKKRIVESRLKEGLASWKPKCESYSRRPRPIVCTLGVYDEFVDAVESDVRPGQYKDLLADLRSLAEYRAPCVFVRFASLLGLYPYVDENSLEKATQLAHELATDLHFVLVIGDPGGLEKELCKQVLQVCRMAEIEDEEITRIIDHMVDERKNSYHYTNLEKSRVVSLLFSPTVAELQEVLSNNVSFKLHIIFAGHASEEGLLIDRRYFGESEICKCVGSIRFSYGIYLVLDCCCACKVFDAKKVKHELERTYLVHFFEDPDAVITCIRNALDNQNSGLQDSQLDIKNERSFTKTVVKLYKWGFQGQSVDHMHKRVISTDIQLKDLDLSVPLYVYPLSASHLDPRGAMREFYSLKGESCCDDRRLIKRIRRLLSTLYGGRCHCNSCCCALS